MLNYDTPKVYLPRPQRLYPYLKSYRKRSNVPTDSVKDILAEYDLTLIDRPVLLSGRNRNISLVVNTFRGKKILKKYQKSLGITTIVQEHSILKYLAQIGFPASRLVESKSGQTLIQEGEDRYVLFDFIDGGFCSYDYFKFPWQACQFIAIAGEMLAILHGELSGFIPEGYNPDGFKSRTTYERWRDTEWFADKLRLSIHDAELRNENRKDRKLILLLERARQLEKILVENTAVLKSAGLPSQIIHRDYCPSHLFFRNNAPPVIIDFEISRLDWRLVDIVDGIKNFCTNKKGYFSKKKLIVFLSAYQTHTSLTSSELELLPEMWKLIHVWQCIFNWHQFSLTGRINSIISAVQYIRKLDWVIANQNMILKCCSKF